MLNNVRGLLLLVPILATAGCSGAFSNIVAQPDPTVELLESELRWLEDNLYRMDDQLERCLEQLESARRDNATLRIDLAESLGQRTDTSSTKSRSPTLAGQTDSEDFDEEKEMDDGDLYDLSPPKIEPGEATNAGKTSEDPSGEEESGANTPELPNDNIELKGVPDPERMERPKLDPGTPSRDPFTSDTVSAPSEEVTRIVLNRRLTGAYDFDGQSGHDGVMVVVEPQNAYAQYVPVAGNITVEVRDPEKSGLAGRVGKWKFDAIETAASMKKTLMGQGVHLQLPWPSEPPRNEQLLLSVTYEPAGGRKLKSEKKIRFKPSVSALISRAEEAEQSVWKPDRRTNTATLPGWRPNR